MSDAGAKNATESASAWCFYFVEPAQLTQPVCFVIFVYTSRFASRSRALIRPLSLRVSNLVAARHGRATAIGTLQAGVLLRRSSDWSKSLAVYIQCCVEVFKPKDALFVIRLKTQKWGGIEPVAFEISGTRPKDKRRSTSKPTCSA